MQEGDIHTSPHKVLARMGLEACDAVPEDLAPSELLGACLVLHLPLVFAAALAVRPLQQRHDARLHPITRGSSGEGQRGSKGASTRELRCSSSKDHSYRGHVLLAPPDEPHKPSPTTLL